MEPVFRTMLLAAVEQIQDRLPSETQDCTGCGRAAPDVQPCAEDDSNLLCFACRQIAHSAANPWRWAIVEGSV